MTALPNPLQIVGYASELSVRAGDTLSFHVSSALHGRYTATVHHLLGGGFDPRAPQLRTVPVARLGEHALLDQRVPIGSRAQAAWGQPLPLAEATFVSNVQRRLVGAAQTLLWLGGPERGLSAELSAEGLPVVRLGGETILRLDAAVPPMEWTRLVVSWSASRIELSVLLRGEWRRASAILDRSPDPASVLTLAAAPRADGGWTGHFSGRLERPALLGGAHDPETAVELVGEPGDPVPEAALSLWEFSDGIADWSVPGRGARPADLTLHQAPVRGVRGSTWVDATSYRDAPTQFGAIHFHEDSLEDCEWEPQAEWTVPAGTRSGFYALHVVSGEHDDWIPFFVRPETGAPGAELLLVASSATYFAYANSRFWWEDPIQEIAQDRLVELGREEQYLVTHPELGLSNYDRHLDGAPVDFSSRRRPNLFMRPGHSRAESYASDLYLVAWLEQAGIAYDVVTDEDLHFDGGALLDPYRAVLSGSHPEYLSIDMFDSIASWVETGGRYLYLGGNGYTSCVTWRSDRPWLMENRTTGVMQNDELTTATETINQLDGRIGRDMADSGRATGSLWGVDMATMGFDRSYPLVRSEASYAEEFSWAFEGIPGRLFGGRSLSGNGVIGQEWDNARMRVGTPGHYVLASTVDHSLIPEILGADHQHHGDVVAFFRGRGLVLSGSSMAWAGALHIDDYRNDAERFVRNVVTRFIASEPIPAPHPSEPSEVDS